MSFAIGTSKFKSILCCPEETLSVVSSITLPTLFLNSKVILFEPSEYIIAELIIHSLNASKIKCWSPLKKPPVPNVLSGAPPKDIDVLALGSKLDAFGSVHPRIGATQFCWHEDWVRYCPLPVPGSEQLPWPLQSQLTTQVDTQLAFDIPGFNAWLTTISWNSKITPFPPMWQ